MRDPFSGVTPHVMTDGEIAEIIAGFATSATNLLEAGFDGVELHGAHGYLIEQFLSPWSNQRTDKWGGPVQNRARILVEAIRAIRAATGPSFVVGIKLSVNEYVPGGLDLELSREIVKHLLVEAAPDYVAASQGNFSPSLELHVPDMRFPDVPFSELPRGIRAVAAGVPVMGLAKVPDLDAADRLVEDRTADLVGLSRPLIADPNLVSKSQSGVAPRPCIYCNVCWHLIQTHRKIMCIYGADGLKERNAGVASARARVRVARQRTKPEVRVVGGGPAGLEVARVAAERGHTVRLYEARLEVGGRLTQEASIEGREPVRAAATWLENEVRRLGVAVECSATVSAVEIERWDERTTLFVAIGAEPIVELLPGANAVISLEDAIVSLDHLSGPVVIIDEIEDEPVYAAAEMIRHRGLEVSIVTRRPQVGRHVAYINLIGALRRLDQGGIGIHTLAIPLRITGGQLVAQHPFSGAERSICNARTIVRAGPYRSRELAVPLRFRSTVVGDASAPRALAAVMREANVIARSQL